MRWPRITFEPESIPEDPADQERKCWEKNLEMMVRILMQPTGNITFNKTDISMRLDHCIQAADEILRAIKKRYPGSFLPPLESLSIAPPRSSAAPEKKSA